ncbi:hypothetical protein CU097_003965, partial [Rhizopus azygosporus]
IFISKGTIKVDDAPGTLLSDVLDIDQHYDSAGPFKQHHLDSTKAQAQSNLLGHSEVTRFKFKTMSGDVDLDIDLGDIEKPSVQAKVLKPVKEFL